jgi:MFS family permease
MRGRPALRRLAHALGMKRGVAALAAGLFVYGFGQELWIRYLPVYLRFLGATPLLVGAFGTLKDLLDAAYAYPGGALTDRLGGRRALLLFGSITLVGFVVFFLWSSVAAVFLGILLVMAWPSLGLPATFSIIGEELEGPRRIVGFTVQAVLKRLPIVLAPPVGGLLLQKLGVARGMQAGFGASIVLGAAMLLGLGRAFGAPATARGSGKAPAPARRLTRSLRRLLAADILIRLCEGLPDVFIIVWIVEVRRISPARFGMLISILMATAIVSYFPAAALANRAEKKWFIVLTYVFFTLYPLAIVLSRSFAGLVGAFVIGGLREIGEPARKAFIVDCAHPSSRGRAVGLYYAIRGFSVAGAATVGGLLWTIRPPLTFLAATGLGAAGTIACAWLLPSGRSFSGKE